jgi:hypothetical protein
MCKSSHELFPVTVSIDILSVNIGYVAIYCTYSEIFDSSTSQ